MIISLVLMFFFIVLAFKYPPFMLALYIFIVPTQTFGVASALPVPLFLYSRMDLLMWIATFASLRQICREKIKDICWRRKMFISTVALFATLWVVLSNFYVFGKINNMMKAPIDLGVFAIIIVLAYHQKRWARILFTAVVFLQVLIAAGLLLAPDGPFSVFSSSNPSRYYDIKTGDYVYEGEILGIKKFAQFHNSVPLCFYGAIGVFLSFLLLKSRGKIKMLGVVFMCLGFISLYFGFSRSIILGMILGAAQLFLRSPKRFILFVFLGGLLYLSAEWVIQSGIFDFNQFSWISEFIFDFEYGAGLDYRVSHFKSNIEMLLIHPVFGMGSYDNLIAQTGGLAHQAIVYYSALYGFPMMVSLVLLFWYAMVGNLFIGLKKGSGAEEEGSLLDKNKAYFSVLVGWATFSMSLTNNMTGAFSWACLGIAYLTWVYVPSKTRIAINGR